ncbi:MAG: DUF721 domain-containing protein [Bacteroidetes bacterium]|nr:DUF721 domain-containing protein [Bacteroidota bacterium]
MKIAVEQYLKAMGLDRKMLETSVLSKWGALMGDAVEQRTESKEIRDEVLYLKINSSVMRNELFQMRSVIVKRLNEEAGFEMIKDVFFQ